MTSAGFSTIGQSKHFAGLLVWSDDRESVMRWKKWQNFIRVFFCMLDLSFFLGGSNRGFLLFLVSVLFLFAHDGLLGEVAGLACQAKQLPL